VKDEHVVLLLVLLLLYLLWRKRRGIAESTISYGGTVTWYKEGPGYRYE
jgi:hypothetical protein